MRRHLLLWFLGALFTLPVGACATSDCAAADANCNDLQALLLYGLQARYVTVGAGGIIAVGSSPTSWTVASPGAGNLNAVAYGSRGFVAVGAAGQIWHSIDGRPGTWFARSSGTTDNLTGVAASGGTYIAAGGIAPNPRILRSTDAIQWTDVTAPIGQPLLQAAYLPVSGGQFVVTGLNGARAVSANGINWTIFSPASDNLLGGIAYGNGRVVCGSDSGVVFSGDGVATMAALGSVSGAVTSGVVFYRGAFLMASDGGEVYRSASG
ncbi:MAG: hypothetical protein K1X75_18140, partial [Leptospirales bacterium]|nr:hypothetical protein [Leptospirales bacterium]